MLEVWNWIKQGWLQGSRSNRKVWAKESDARITEGSYFFFPLQNVQTTLGARDLSAEVKRTRRVVDR